MTDHKPFPWLYSLLTKAGILSAGVVSLMLMGWPVADTQEFVESTSSIVNTNLADEIAKTDLLNASDHESYLQSTRVDLNQGELADFERLPGIGIVLAQRIIDHRHTHGHFQTVTSLQAVPGIGKARIARLRSLVTVKQDRQHKQVVGSMLSAS